jgi:uncharacterized protein (DUF4415 family)
MKRDSAQRAKGAKRAPTKSAPVKRKKRYIRTRGIAKIADRTDFARLDAMTDDDIATQLADPDVAPEWTDEMIDRAEVMLPPKKVPISLRVDPDVLSFYKRSGHGYQSRMNAVLRSYMEQKRRKS